MASHQWIDITDAAAITGFCTRTLRRNAASGELPAYKVGRALRFRIDDVHAWMESNRLPSAKSGAPRKSAKAK